MGELKKYVRSLAVKPRGKLYEDATRRKVESTKTDSY